MSSIIDRSRYFSRSRHVGIFNPAGVDVSDLNSRKPFLNAFSVNALKIFDGNLNKFYDGPMANGYTGLRIFCSNKTDTVYTASSVISGYRDDGFYNCFESMETAVEGKLLKSVKCYCGPFINGHLLDADIGVKLIGVYEMGLAVMSDFNMHPTRKTPFSEFGPPTDSSISCDRTLMVVANRDHSVTLLELRNFSLADRFHSSSCFTPTGIDFSPINKHSFITCSKGFTNDCNYVSLWDTRSNKSGTINVTLSQPANCLKWSKRNGYLVPIATIDGFVHVIDTRNPDGEVHSMKIDADNPISRMKMIDDKLIGFNRTNNVVRIDEIQNEFTILETGLPSDFIVRDIVEHKSNFYAIGHKSILPHPIDITL